MRKTISKWGVCYWCGTTDGPFEADHVFPASLMEDNDVRNLVCSCRKCNREKGNKPIGSWSIDGRFEFRNPEEAEKIRGYYNNSLCRYKKLTLRGYNLFMAKKRWECKPVREFIENQSLYKPKNVLLERAIDVLKYTIEDLKTDCEFCAYWEYEHGAWQCSECGEDNPYGIDYCTVRFSDYCPGCGLPMRVRLDDIV